MTLSDDIKNRTKHPVLFSELKHIWKVFVSARVVNSKCWWEEPGYKVCSYRSPYEIHSFSCTVAFINLKKSLDGNLIEWKIVPLVFLQCCCFYACIPFCISLEVADTVESRPFGLENWEAYAWLKVLTRGDGLSGQLHSSAGDCCLEQ